MERKQYGQPDFVGPPIADELEAEKRTQQPELTETSQPVKTNDLAAPAGSGIQNDHEKLGDAIRDTAYAQAEFEKGGHPLNEFEQAKFENEPGDGFSIDHDGVDRDGDGQDYDELDYG